MAFLRVFQFLRTFDTQNRVSGGTSSQKCEEQSAKDTHLFQQEFRVRVDSCFVAIQLLMIMNSRPSQ